MQKPFWSYDPSHIFSEFNTSPKGISEKTAHNILLQDTSKKRSSGKWMREIKMFL